MGRHRIYTFLILFISIVFGLFLMPRCCRTCTVEYSDARALKSHQSKCPQYLADIAAFISRQNQDSDNGQGRGRGRGMRGFRGGLLGRGSAVQGAVKRAVPLQTRKERILAVAGTSMKDYIGSYDTTMDVDNPLQQVDGSITNDNDFFPSISATDSAAATSNNMEAHTRHLTIRIPRQPATNILPEHLLPLQSHQCADLMEEDEPSSPLEESSDETPHSRIKRVTLFMRDRFQTAQNVFGMWRQYLWRPSFDPDSLLSLDDLANPETSHLPEHASVANTTTHSEPIPNLHPNLSTALLMEWLNNGQVTKSEQEVNKLVHDVILHPEFNPADLQKFEAGRENHRIDEVIQHTNKEMDHEMLLQEEGFRNASVEIEVPSGDKTIPSKRFPVPGLQYRPLLSVLRAAFTDSLSSKLHLSGFKLFRTLKGKTERIFSEIYNSDVFLIEQDAVRRKAPVDPNDPFCKREKVVAALMFWSDATHLANFGTAKLWPIYMLLGNLSKYIRSQPTLGACHHLAYIPSLPDSVIEAISRFHTKWSTQKKDILTHCRRELFHAVWKLLLDDEFLHAYHYGVVIRCHDGIERRVYPRFFTYSADYPEKVLIASIRDMGLCPCPRCLTEKKNMHLFGSVRDTLFRLKKQGIRKFLTDKVLAARKFIYERAFGITSTAVNNLLQETSSVPTMNAFIDRLGNQFELNRMLVVDFMHEVELGSWKALFTHLIRILDALADGPRKIQELNSRYRQIPRFGTETIRSFVNDTSEMKKLAARDFEDLLQCAMPVFDGLLPDEEDNKRLMNLLFKMAEWHGFVKSRMHTETTLEHLKSITKQLGQFVREFRDKTCIKFDTYETQREATTRQRRAAERVGKGDGPATSTSGQSRKRKTLNLNTYKWHAISDYADTIVLFGTSDSYSTQVGEQAHRFVKRMYRLTNKRDTSRQIAKRYMRVQFAHTSAKQRQYHDHLAPDPGPAETIPMEAHYHISDSRSHPISIYDFVKKNAGDPAVKKFIPHLKDHIFGRMLQRPFDGDDHDDFTDEDRNDIRIINNRMYSIGRLSINYTTYDVRRARDSLNPRNQCSVMVHSAETGQDVHPFWYAQVLGVFHAMVQYVPMRKGRTFSQVPQSPQRMDFLWVRWYGAVHGEKFSFKKNRLPKVGFVPEDDEYAFGFLDPAMVIRGCHMMPAFADGKTNELLTTQQTTLARPIGVTDDWKSFYVGIFVDRDMIHRYFGGAVGHPDGIEAEDLMVEPDEDTSESGSDSESVLNAELEVMVEQRPGEPGPNEGVAEEDSDTEEDGEGSEVLGEQEGESDSDDDFDDEGYAAF